MTQRARARFGRATRFGVITLVAIILMLMGGDRPLGQAPAGNAIDFDGTNDFIALGNATGAASLGATTFTLELWFKREGAGVTTSTGTGGHTAVIPLVTKGRGEADGSNLDTNYFLGITSAGVLAADFEDTATGLNHPVLGVTAVPAPATPAAGVWHHAAATYDGTTWRLYLNGVLETTEVEGNFTPRSDSIQHAAIGSAMQSGGTGTAAGFFNGVIDEVRIWNVVRTQAEILASRNQELTSGTGLIGRWGMNEASGNALNSVAGKPDGVLTNGPTRVAGFPIPDSTPPAAPQNVMANSGNGRVTIAWDQNADSDLAGYNIYRNGSGTPLNGTLLTIPIFTDGTVTNGQAYTYVVRAVDTSSNPSAPSIEVNGAPSLLGGAGMQFNGTSQYVTFGQATGAAGLGATTFTLEAWFKRTGAGIPTNTGSGGLPSAVPLITKGMAETEAPPEVNMNYFLGIRSTDNVLVADFEDTATGLNHPVIGSTPIPISTTAWHHVAATYDGDEWRLYLDGVLETTLFVGAFTPESSSIQHAVIGSALNSTGGVGSQPQGFFHGILDEVRIWNYARSTEDIQFGMNKELFVGPIGRFGLNEAAGNVVGNTAGATAGTAVGTPIWSAGYPFPADTLPPAAPEDLVATPGISQVSLHWTANSEPDLAGYNVYRRTSSTAFGLPLNGATLLTSPSYLDTTVTNGIQYFYTVTAVDVLNNPSDFSTEADATPSSNPPPVVNAGPDRTITLTASAALSGVVTDHGPFSTLWSQVSGPGSVSFANEASPSTTATFTQTGAYVLRLTANDGQSAAFDDMTVTVVDPVLVGAGDIAPNCVAGNSLAAPEAVATLLDGIPGAVFTLGDNAYQDGTAQEFAQCYDPTWGRHKARTRPVTGNHDYNTANGIGYYDYFNGVGVQDGPAGDRTVGGYYSYNIGNWHVVVLNSECTALWNLNGCAAGSPQEQWLRADLAASPTNNIIAMWHRPLYSSSSPDSTHDYLQPLWQALYDYGTDIYLGGHWHNYERLAPMDAIGALDTAFGIRTFVIGTGGINLSGAYPNIRPTSEVRNNATHGVMKFTLHDSSYDWEFVPIAGQSFTDSGSGTVHGAPGGNVPPIVLAGIDQTVAVGAASLSGTVTDDGPTTVTWSQMSGPVAGTATFGNPNSAATSVGFPVAGVYVLQLTADDGLFVRSDTVTITVTTASGNLPPIVSAGQDQTITLPATASLSGTLSDDGMPGADVTSTWSNQTPAIGTVTFVEATNAVTTASFSAPGTYVLRLTATDGELDGFDDVTIAVNPATPNNAIDFGGTNAYVTFGPAPGLGVTTMTIEAWFRRDGAGATAESGTSGVIATPIVAKGTSESDGSNVDLNYFMGITAGGLLVADFEDNATGLNHPVTGTTVIPLSNTLWHHAAATYDGTTWRLYLDGVLEATQAVGAFTPRSDSVQHGSIGSALTSTGSPEGFFDGVIDEVRIWNRALSTGEILANLNQQITTAPNLVARWGLNETNGNLVNDSTPGPINGTITGAAWVRTAGAPFNLTPNHPPNVPAPNQPANGGTGLSASPNLSVNVSDSDGDSLDVTFYGRSMSGPAPSDFTIVAIPDTQHYVDDPNRAATFTAQTQWIVQSRPALNTVFVSHLGDITEHIDAQPIEWTRADASMDVLDAAVPPVPYGIAPGNHDMSSAGVATNYDLLFPVSRMSGYPWYGGYLGQHLFNFTDPINRENKNQFSLFSAGGMDFVVIHLEYDMPTYAVAWADRVLKAYPNRRAIIATHLFLSDSGSRPTTVLNRTADGLSAATVWTNLIVPNCNVFMVLNGHYPGEANRTDPTPTNAACPGRTVHQLESDYQSRANGGDGWLRYMTFKPSENKVYVYTYSPTRNGGSGEFETDANSQFVVDYNMQGTPFTEIATNTGVASGNDTETTWAGRAPNTQYEWYATVSDGNQTVKGPTWTFTTAPAANNPPTADAQSVSTAEDTGIGITLTGSDPESAPLTFNIESGPSNGTLTGNGASRTYTPAANYNGPDSFTFTVNDGGATSGPATVSITVTPVNDTPTANAQSVTTPEDTGVGITLAGSDPEGSTLTFSIGTAPLHGTLTGSGASRTYTPAANYNGPDSFTFTVSDGTAASAPATVSITVTGDNDLPAANAQSVTTPEDTSVAITLTGTDPEGLALTFNILSGPANGTLTGTGASRTYTPAANYNGPDSFTFTVNDGELTSAPATISITVTAVNDTPTATAQSVTTPEDTGVAITLTGSDPEGAALTFNILSAPTRGTLTGTGATRTYTPTTNLNGPDSFTFTVNDGTATSAPATVSLSVTPVNDPPLANGQNISTSQGVPVSIILTGSDPDGGPFSFAVQGAPANGTLTGTPPNLTYTPGPAFVGGDSFTFTVNDGTTVSAPATVSISVNLAAPFTALGVGTHFPTVDNADQGAGPGPRSITPPAVQLGDLVVIVATYRGTATLTMTQTGGQLWTSEANTQANAQTVRVFWTQFNGIWTGNPAVTNTTGTSPLTVYSFAIDMAPGTYPEIDVPFQSGNHAGGTVTVPAFNTNTNGALALAGWISGDNNTWGAPPAGWSMPGGQLQWRNGNGSDSSIALAYRNMTSAGTTGAIARTQTANGPDNGLYFRMAFKATLLNPAAPPDAPANLMASASLGQVGLTWQDNATNEFAFQIERCVNSGCTNFAPLAGLGSNTTSFVDTTAASSTTYRYRVRAVNVFGPSQYSGIVDATTPTPPFTFRGVGAHFPTVENADQGGGPGPRAITPPASLQPGDLIVIVASYRGTATLSLSETGGQIWTSETNAQANGQTVRVFWSQFNGFWTANPAVTNTTGTLPITVYSFAFDMAPGLYPVIDVPFVSGSHAGGTVTVPAFNTNSDGALVLTGWISSDNNTWGAPTAGWSTPGGQAQWRNSNGSDSSVAFAYRLMGPAGPTGNIARAQSANGPDNGLYFRLAFQGQPVPSDPPSDPSDLQAAASMGQVALTWLDHATNEAGFNIERCAGAACTNFAPHAVAGPNQTSYNDTNVTASTIYRYQVRAFNLFSPSNYSNIATAETPAPPPAPPVPFTFRSVGTHFPAADNTAGAGPGPRTVTPPATMQAGDLFVIVALYRESATLSLVNTGGQTWTSEANMQGNDLTARVFWTRFNGTWAGTPSVTNTTGTEPLTVYSFAAAMSPGMHPEIDVPVVSGTHSGGTVTVPSFTTNTAGTLALVGWVSDENNTWAAPTAGWSVPGGQLQWRNTQGEDTSLALAYRVFTTAGATGSIARTQAETDSGFYFRLAWKQVPD